MSSDDVAIRVNCVSKCYLMYDRSQDRLKQSIVPRMQRLVGRATTQYYREFWALKDVSFNVRKGQTLGIVGRNGSGKSTLLQMICGTLTPTEGSIEVKGRVAALLELGSGFNPEFTGRENVYLNGTILGLTRAQIDARLEKILQFADIGDFIDQQVKTYSSGMSMRLAFAVIAHVDADVLVIDEALSVGDAFFVQKCMRFLRQFKEKGTILFVSHDTGAITNFCDAAVWLNKGRVERMGSPKEISEAYLAQIFQAAQGQHMPNDRGVKAAATTASVRDMRLDYINSTSLRNDIELFGFSPDAASFGKGGATIVSATLSDSTGAPLSWVVGGERIVLNISILAHESLEQPIVGFFVKDRLGQTLFGDNSYLTYLETPPPAIPSGRALQAKFAFAMPILPVGDYSICIAIATGTQLEHVQHHWLHDAIMIKSHSSSVCMGLVGIPMERIELKLAEI